mmetsp:Transcript_18264/g.28957  ORF Transcript_18264/g.28957 Transcript_18264/m.28957 type:complete len:109 (+) Transcript_18264:393-719(+)
MILEGGAIGREMKRHTVQRNLLWGAVFGLAAFGTTRFLPHMPDVILDAGLAWVVVATVGVLMLLTFVFGFVLGVFPVVVTLHFRNILAEEEKRGRYAIILLFMIDEYR